MKRFTSIASLFVLAAFGALASSPVCSNIPRLPLRDFNEFWEYSTNQVQIFMMSAHFESPGATNGYWDYAGTRWEQMGNVNTVYARDIPLPDAMKRDLNTFLTSGLSNLVAKARERSPSDPTSVRFMSQSCGLSDDWDAGYVWVINLFQLQSDGTGGYVVPDSASDPNFIDYQAEVWPVKVRSNGLLKWATITIRYPGGEVEELDSRLVPYPYPGTLWVTSKGCLGIPIRFLGAHQDGEVLLSYDRDGTLTERFDLATGDRLLAPDLSQRLDRSTNGLRLVITGRVPTNSLTLDAASQLGDWQEVSVLTNYHGLAWWDLSATNGVSFFRARTP